MESPSITSITQNELGLEATIAIQNLHYPFPEYAIAVGTPYLRTSSGQLKQIRRKKVVLKRKGNELEVAAIVGSSFALIPNELVEDMTEKAIAAYGLTMLAKKHDRYENTVRIDLLSERKAEVQVGDIVQFGVSIRNSIDGTSALAVDLFSYRLKCRNGATARVADMTFSARHVGDPRELVKQFNRALSEALERTDRLLELYRSMSQIRLSREAAEKILQLGFPAKYYRYTPILVRERERENNGSIELRYEGSTLWDTFNAITRVVTHESRASPLARSYMTHRLHRVMQELVGSVRQ